MNERDFCYWLQGFLEVANPSSISPSELTEIRNHLDLTLGRTHTVIMSNPSGTSYFNDVIFNAAAKAKEDAVTWTGTAVSFNDVNSLYVCDCNCHKIPTVLFC